MDEVSSLPHGRTCEHAVPSYPSFATIIRSRTKRWINALELHQCLQGTTSPTRFSPTECFCRARSRLVQRVKPFEACAWRGGLPWGEHTNEAVMNACLAPRCGKALRIAFLSASVIVVQVLGQILS